MLFLDIGEIIGTCETHFFFSSSFLFQITPANCVHFRIPQKKKTKLKTANDDDDDDEKDINLIMKREKKIVNEPPKSDATNTKS